MAALDPFTNALVGLWVIEVATIPLLLVAWLTSVSTRTQRTIVKACAVATVYGIAGVATAVADPAVTMVVSGFAALGATFVDDMVENASSDPNGRRLDRFMRDGRWVWITRVESPVRYWYRAGRA